MKKVTKYYKGYTQLQTIGYINDNGKKTGKWTWYYDTGDVECIGHYKDDIWNGTWAYYNITGGINFINYYIYGNEVSEQTYRQLQNIKLITG